MNQTKKNTENNIEKQFRAGIISATVWKNKGMSKKGEVTEFRTISLQRGYKDKSGEWQNTTSLRVNDLPKAAFVLNKAYEYLITMSSEDKGVNNSYSSRNEIYGATQDNINNQVLGVEEEVVM